MKEVKNKQRKLAFRSTKGEAKPLKVVTDIGQPLKVTRAELTKEPVQYDGRSLIPPSLEFLANLAVWFFRNYRIRIEKK